MDLEAPVDAWYVWLGVAIVSIGAGLVILSLPSEPPPDANQAANTIDDVATSPHNASAFYDHRADEVKISVTSITLRNDAGEKGASIAFGQMTPVRQHPDEHAIEDGLDVVRYDDDPRNVWDTPAEMNAWAEAVREHIDTHGADWQESHGVVRVERVHWGDYSVTFVDA